MSNSREILRSLIEVNEAVCIAYQKINFDIYDFEFRQYFEIRPDK